MHHHDACRVVSGLIIRNINFGRGWVSHCGYIGAPIVGKSEAQFLMSEFLVIGPLLLLCAGSYRWCRRLLLYATPVLSVSRV